MFGALKMLGGSIVQGASDGINAVGDAVGDAAGDAAGGVGRTVGGVAHAVGNAFGDGVDFVSGEAGRGWEGLKSHYLGGLEAAKAFAGSGIESWGNKIDAIDDIAHGRFGKGLKGLSGYDEIARGVYDLAHGRVKAGLGGVLGGVAIENAPVVDAGMVRGAREISAIQTVAHLEAPGRGLRPDEVATLREVFGNSLDYDAIQIKEGRAGLFSLNDSDRPFTAGNVIYFKSKVDLANPESRGSLIHEAVHSWQYQNGGADYMRKALYAQATAPGGGYDWSDDVKNGKTWSELNPEQQGKLIERYAKHPSFSDPSIRFMVDGDDFTDYARAALAELRAGRGAP